MVEDDNSLSEEERSKRLKKHVLQYCTKRFSSNNKPIKLSLDYFQDLMVDAMDAAAYEEDLIPEHMRLICGLELVQDEDLYQEAAALAANC